MGVLYNALEGLSPLREPELLDGYRRYEEVLTDILTPEQMETYADYIARSGEVRILEELTPAEIDALPFGMPTIAANIVAETTISMENRRVAALLNQYGEHGVTPDYQATPSSPSVY